MKYIGLTRGGNNGAIAILEVSGETKYYDVNGIVSLSNNSQNVSHKEELKKALTALEGIIDYEDIPEFESGIPQQGMLF